MKRILPILLVALGFAACQDVPTTVPADGPQRAGVPAELASVSLMSLPEEAVPLGKAIFFDAKLSLNKNEACSFCHAPEYGFGGPNPGINRRGAVYMGSVRNRFGNRRPPSAAYATLSPLLHYDLGDEVWVGGNFWDGRATGELLGNPAADQALGPFLNPVEQGLPDEICVVYRIAQGSYADLWVEAWGEDLRDLGFPAGLDKACKNEGDIEYSGELEAQVEEAFHKVGRSIAAYEASPEVNAFSSKYDAVMAGMAEFTPQEALGQEVFDSDEQGRCFLCHLSEGEGALFTDYTYDNLGVPANPMNPAYATGFVDLGIGGYLETLGDPGAEDLYGAVKVPTLRNVAKAPGNAPKSFGHNGFFKSLEQIVHFYNTRDVLPTCDPGQVNLLSVAGMARVGFEPACWPAPEVAENVNHDELGDLGLTAAEEQALVAFMKTLSDGWMSGK